MANTQLQNSGANDSARGNGAQAVTALATALLQAAGRTGTRGAAALEAHNLGLAAEFFGFTTRAVEAIEKLEGLVKNLESLAKNLQVVGEELALAGGAALGELDALTALRESTATVLALTMAMDGGAGLGAVDQGGEEGVLTALTEAVGMPKALRTVARKLEAGESEFARAVSALDISPIYTEATTDAVEGLSSAVWAIDEVVVASGSFEHGRGPTWPMLMMSSLALWVATAERRS